MLTELLRVIEVLVSVLTVVADKKCHTVICRGCSDYEQFVKENIASGKVGEV